MLYKGDGSGYWLPELIRADLEGKFRAVSSQSEYWKFTQETLGEYLFNDEQMTLQNDSLNWEYHNSLNEETFSDYSKGHLFVGPVRMV